MIRSDIHRPSAVVPSDYEYVAQECAPFEGMGSAAFIQAERKIINEHMAHTGGHFSEHEHGGNCMVCGSVNAIYTLLFYHPKSNSYVRLGSDCASKMYDGDDFGASEFRRRVQDAREAQAGKNKARLLLSDYGLSQAWDIYAADFGSLPTQANGSVYWEESTIRDIVSKFVKYGSISDKQRAFIGSLLGKIAQRPALLAARAQEKASASDVPSGRVTIQGVIVSLKDVESAYGVTTKMLVKHESGYRVFGTLPGNLVAGKGDMVQFTATVEPSRDDPKFGFFSRPTKASMVWQTPTFQVVAA